MTPTEALTHLVQTLDECRIAYMFVGSLSSNVYGVVRATKDADVVVQMKAHELSSLVATLGDSFLLDAQMTFETLTGTTRHILRLSDSPYTVELFFLSDDAHDQTRFQRRRKLLSPDVKRGIFIPTAEDVIIMKLRWARSKDKDDVRDVIAVQGDDLDWSYIYGWCEQHGTRALVDEIKASIPPLD
jgi:hypothetical protein